MKKTNNIIILACALFAFGCFTLLPSAQAVSPAPDGGYPGANTAEGEKALLSLTNGAYNTAVGFLSLRSGTNASFNTGVGAGTLALSNGSENTATGAGALLLNATGASNTANGGLALLYNSGGSDNSAFGDRALFNSTGSNNTALGSGAGFNLTTGDNNIDIGNEGVAGDADTIRIGATQTNTFVAGIYGVTPAGPDPLPVGVDMNGQLGTIPSSPSSQAVVTGSRALNSVFHNIGSRPLFVSLTCTMGNGSAEGIMNALTDANNPPTTEVARVGSGAVSSLGERDGLQVFFIVLPGNYYKISTTGTVILHDWTEWQ